MLRKLIISTFLYSGFQGMAMASIVSIEYKDNLYVMEQPVAFKVFCQAAFVCQLRICSKGYSSCETRNTTAGYTMDISESYNKKGYGVDFAAWSFGPVIYKHMDVNAFPGDNYYGKMWGTTSSAQACMAKNGEGCWRP